MLDENQLTVIDENGNELLCEILFTFDSDDYNKSYVVYYPAGAEHEDEDGNVDLHVSAYVPSNNNEGGELLPVETDAEWDMIEEVINTFLADEEAEGRVALCLYHKYNEPLSTNVVVRRASSKDNYATWEDIRVFNFIDEYINPENKEQAKARVFYDYTIESGVFYKYCTETEDEYGNRTALYMPNDMTPIVRYFDSAYLLC